MVLRFVWFSEWIYLWQTKNYPTYTYIHIHTHIYIYRYIYIYIYIDIYIYIYIMRVFPRWGPWDRISFFFLFFFSNDSDIFFKYFNSNHHLPSYSLRFVLVVLFFTPPLARDSLSRSSRACLRLTEKRWKIAPVLQIQASSMKLKVNSFLFLVFLHIEMDGKNKLFVITISTFR